MAKDLNPLPKFGDIYVHTPSGGEFVVCNINRQDILYVVGISRHMKHFSGLAYIGSFDRHDEKWRVSQHYEFKRSLTACEAKWIKILGFGKTVDPLRY